MMKATFMENSPSHPFLGECPSQKTLMNVRWDYNECLSLKNTRNYFSRENLRCHMKMKMYNDQKNYPSSQGSY